MYYSTRDGFEKSCCECEPQYSNKKYVVKREQERCKSDIKPLNHDFLEDLPRYISDIMWRIEDAWKAKDWFEEAWNKYRDHVLSSVESGSKIKNPGFVFNDYIDNQIKEDFLNYEQNQVLHSDADVSDIYLGSLGNVKISDLMHANPYHDPETGKFTSANKAGFIDVNKVSKTSTTVGKSIQGVTTEISKIPVKKGQTIRGSYPELSDAELQSKVNRMNLEQRYSDLKGDTKYVKSGGEKAREALQTIGALTGIALALMPIIATIGNAIKKRKLKKKIGGKK